MTIKKLFYFSLLGVFACEKPQTTNEPFPPVAEENNVWIAYEGRVPLNEDDHLYFEIRMLPADQMGEGIFEMEEFAEGDGNNTRSSYKGKYSTLYGEAPEERIVQFHNSVHPTGFKRSYLATGFQGNVTDSRLKMIREEPFRTTDLTVKIAGKNKLLVLDDHLRPVSLEAEYNLIKRTSKPFTLEGYFRHNGDSADFFEINTGENWAVSKYGEYRKAIRQYHQLSKEKFDVTYLKGIGFSIRHPGRDGREIDALVIKKVLQMTSAPNPDEN